MPNNPPRREDNPVRRLAAMGVSPIKPADDNLMSKKDWKAQSPAAVDRYERWKSGKITKEQHDAEYNASIEKW